MVFETDRASSRSPRPWPPCLRSTATPADLTAANVAAAGRLPPVRPGRPRHRLAVGFDAPAASRRSNGPGLLGHSPARHRLSRPLCGLGPTRSRRPRSPGSITTAGLAAAHAPEGRDPRLHRHRPRRPQDARRRPSGPDGLARPPPTRPTGFAPRVRTARTTGRRRSWPSARIPSPPPRPRSTPTRHSAAATAEGTRSSRSPAPRSSPAPSSSRSTRGRASPTWTEVGRLPRLRPRMTRVYVLDRTSGEVRFGDGINRAIPVANPDNPDGNVVARASIGPAAAGAETSPPGRSRRWLPRSPGSTTATSPTCSPPPAGATRRPSTTPKVRTGRQSQEPLPGRASRRLRVPCHSGRRHAGAGQGPAAVPPRLPRRSRFPASSP